MYALLRRNCRFDAVSLGSILAKYSKIVWLWEEPTAQVEKKPTQCASLMTPVAAEGAPPRLMHGCHPCPEEGEERRKRKYENEEARNSPRRDHSISMWCPTASPWEDQGCGWWGRSHGRGLRLPPDFSEPPGSQAQGTFAPFTPWEQLLLPEHRGFAIMQYEKGRWQHGRWCTNMSPGWSYSSDEGGGKGQGKLLGLLMPEASPWWTDTKASLHGQVLAETFGCFVARGEERVSQDVLPASKDGVTCHHECSVTGEYHRALG